jgi:hypothetical protein
VFKRCGFQTNEGARACEVKRSKNEYVLAAEEEAGAGAEDAFNDADGADFPFAPAAVATAAGAIESPPDDEILSAEAFFRTSLLSRDNMSTELNANSMLVAVGTVSSFLDPTERDADAVFPI